jgi:hypothetical protein
MTLKTLISKTNLPTSFSGPVPNNVIGLMNGVGGPSFQVVSGEQGH